MNLCPTKHSGSRNELIACVWLLNRGYEVYRNVSVHGLIDIIAIKENVIIRLDIKSATYGKEGQHVCPRLSEEQVSTGILPLFVFPDGECWIDEHPRAKLSIEWGNCQAVGCGKEFAINKAGQKFCSDRCRYNPTGRKRGRQPSVNVPAESNAAAARSDARARSCAPSPSSANG